MSVEQSPGQTEAGFLDTVTVGSGFTTNVTVFVSVQPAVFPVTEYVVVIVGLTTGEAVVIPPGSQAQVLAPVPERVAEPPTQIAVGLTAALTVGFGTTVTRMLELLVQLPLLAETE